MPEGFHPPPPDATYGVRREDVPADVRDYVDNLMLQLDEIVARHGIPSFRAAMLIPDAERHERLEAVMDLGDLERYVELIGKYRAALTKKTIPTGDRDWRNVEYGRPFAYDKEKARELGFAELRIEAHPRAQELVDAIYNRDPRFVEVNAAPVRLNEEAIRAFWKTHCADLPDAPGSSMEFFKAMAEHRLSDTIDSDDAATIGNPTRPHVPRFGTPGFVLAMSWKEFDWNDEAAKSAAESPPTRALFRRLFGQEDVTDISRDAVDDMLFQDHENRVPTPEATAVIRDLVGVSGDPSKYELRLMRYDEYARIAEEQGYGRKALFTWFDGYEGHGRGPRYGLIGGGHDTIGGAANIGSSRRTDRVKNFAVRLVLSRK